MGEIDESRMTFIQHLEELRLRLIYCFIVILVGFIVSLYFAPVIFQFLTKPLIDVLPGKGSLAILEITEGFITYLKIALFSGIFFSAPWIFYQVWKFVTPGLYKKEKKFIIPFVLVSSLLFFMGSTFAYKVVFPIGFSFLLKYCNPDIVATLSMKKVFSLIMRMILVFGMVFQMPVFVFALSKLGIINSKSLIHFHRYVIVLIFVLAAILTPPDVVTQIIMAVPLLALYELSILVAWIFGKDNNKDS